MSRLSKEREQKIRASIAGDSALYQWDVPILLDEIDAIRTDLAAAQNYGALADKAADNAKANLAAAEKQTDALLEAAKWTVQFADADAGGPGEAGGLEMLRDAIAKAKRKAL